MSLKIIAAVSQNNIIGNNNGLPWKLPTDMSRFRSLTRFSTVIMGRKTLESIGKPLPDRKNIIVTNQRYSDLARCLFNKEDYKNTDWDFDVKGSVGEAISLAQKIGKENIDDRPIWIIGGGEIYSQTIDIVDEVHLTLIKQNVMGDTTFPRIPKFFKVDSSTDYEDGGISCSYIVYRKNFPNAFPKDL